MIDRSRSEYSMESLLQNISATEREEALQFYNEYFNRIWWIFPQYPFGLYL